jgi:hypothetical protein
MTPDSTGGTWRNLVAVTVILAIVLGAVVLSGSDVLAEGEDPETEEVPEETQEESQDEEVTLTIIIQSVGPGAVDAVTVTGVPVGTYLTAVGNLLDVNGTSVTATPGTDTAQYDFRFLGFYYGPTQITSDAPLQVTSNIVVSATFATAIQYYTVTLAPVNPYGTVTPSVIQNVPYGASIAIEGSTITVNGTQAVAAPISGTDQYAYSFDAWSVPTMTTTLDTASFPSLAPGSDVPITASFAQTTRAYTVTWQDWDGSPISTEQVLYGETPTYPEAAPDRPQTDQYTYAFDAWAPETSVVLGDQTYTATYTRTVNVYTVTWVIGEDTEEQTYEYGQMPEHEKPGPNDEGNDFYDWSPAIGPVTGDITYTATYYDHYTNVAKDMVKLVPILVAVAILAMVAFAVVGRR